ncbi:MAG TPA: pyrroloquinoline quinone biosynthesis protein PqqB [Gemmatimonadales bacterium]|nr:pyrroloquinoline quinone biosynthesis protein PqqB [Gemmatimonadales bacterium]
MQVVLLGTAAGGGFPQWNCWCPPCRIARTDPKRAHPRTQSSAAVSADGSRWFLLNASPDVRDQLNRLPATTPAGFRQSPVEGIVPTDAELDHTLGIALLREGRSLQLYATHAVLEVLEQDSRILPVTFAFARVRSTELPLDAPLALRYSDGSETGLAVTAFPVPGDPPRFARRDLPGHTVGLWIEDAKTGGKLAFVPGCGGLDDPLLARLGRADLLLFDGTFWTDDEMITLGLSDRSARQMDHLPISGPGGSLSLLRALPARQRVYTHINNSNPMLVEDSPERRAVVEAGLMVGDDGMRFSL